MELAVVILNWNAAADTAACLTAVGQWDLAAAPRVWVVDNASREGGLERRVALHPRAELLLSEVNRGFAGGNNLGIKAALDAGAQAVLLLNNDASISAEGVEALLAALASDDSIGVVGPTVWDGERLLSAGGRDIALYGLSHLRPRRPPEAQTDVDYVPGSVALVRRSVFESVGLFDEEYFFAGEMADLCRRARQAGFRCVVEPGARANHRLARSERERTRLHAYYIIRNRFLYVRKHYPRSRAALFVLWTLRGFYAACGAVVRGRLATARAIGLGLADGWRGRFEGRNDRVLA